MARRHVRAALIANGIEPKRNGHRNSLTTAFANLTDDQVVTEYATHDGSVQAIAAAWNCSDSAVYSRLKLARLRSGHALMSPADEQREQRIAGVLERANIQASAVGKVQHIDVNEWGIGAKIVDPKTGQEKLVTEGLYSTKMRIVPHAQAAPEWPVCEPAKPVKIVYKPPTVFVPKGLRVELVLPDVQVGFLRNPQTMELSLPMHDPAAMECAVGIVAAVQPDGIVHVGDLLDFSEMSRWLQVEEFFRTTQPAINEAYRFLAKVEAAAGPGRKARRRKRTRFVAGNHERRASEYLQKNARAAFRLHPAEKTDHWPDLTVPRLLRFDELKIDYMGEWPGSEAWLIEGDGGLVVVHDPRKRNHYYADVIAGHSHRVNSETFSVRSTAGAREFSLHEIGCLCSLDKNPDKLSLMRTRTPSDRGFVKDWAHAVALVEILEATGQRQVTPIRIHGGSALWNGKAVKAAA